MECQSSVSMEKSNHVTKNTVIMKMQLWLQIQPWNIPFNNYSLIKSITPKYTSNNFLIKCYFYF